MITSTLTSLDIKQVALLGNPNAGKSSLFNQLTGLQQKVGNYSGVTIDKLTGTWTWLSKRQVAVHDLPGIYSLFAKAPDEAVVLHSLVHPDAEERPDALILVLDASNLSRSLLLLHQVQQLNYPAVVALNMQDVAADRGIVIDNLALSKVLGLTVIPINARTGEGIGSLQAALEELERQEETKSVLLPPSIDQIELAPTWLQTLHKDLAAPSLFYTKLLLCTHPYLDFLPAATQQKLKTITQKEQVDLIQLQMEDAEQRLDYLEQLAKQVIDQKPQKSSFTQRLDKIFMHPVVGYLIFFGLLLLIFQAIFSLAAVPMDWIDTSFATIGDELKERLPESQFSNLLIDGIWAGLGGIVIFVPQIAILFALIAILEETGYMARVMFLADRTMSRFGLNGKSVVPLISGAACAVPAIMATRSIRSWRERLITIMVTPLMSCAARLPVYIIFIALIVPATTIWGIFSLQSLLLAGLYLGGFVAALLVAWVFNRLWKREIEEDNRAFFVMELPSYKLPQWRRLGIVVLQKTKAFVVDAGKIIIAISIILWVLGTYGPPEAMEQATVEAKAYYQANPSIADSEEQWVASKRLETSFIGQLGRTIEPLIQPLGYDWKIGIALIASFAAREVFVSTMATIYSVDSEDQLPLLDRLRAERHPTTGEPIFSLAVCLSLIVFYMFAMQCMATLAIVQRETQSWKWAFIQLVYMTVLAYVGAFIVYQIFS